MRTVLLVQTCDTRLRQPSPRTYAIDHTYIDSDLLSLESNITNSVVLLAEWPVRRNQPPEETIGMKMYSETFILGLACLREHARAMAYLRACGGSLTSFAHRA